jgi:ABC-type nitrate/sulfonate/bicarbonate transport system substrate-binding protein|tara:strand:+ start:228 stop:470 length:243 start_codon:yes stop_codon:yes gene_type:complete
MNRKYIKENKKLVKEFIGTLVKAILSKQADSIVKKIANDPATKGDVKQIRKLTKDIENKLDKMQKTNPDFAKKFRQKYGY